MTPHDQSVTLSITVDDGNAALEFYQKAFNAEVLLKFPMPDGSLAHADLRIGNTNLYLSEEYPEWKAFSPKSVGGSPNLLCIRDDDFEAIFKRAIELGAEVLQPMQTYPWGSRTGVIVDPFGYRWSIGQQLEELSAEEVMQRMANMPSKT